MKSFNHLFLLFILAFVFTTCQNLNKNLFPQEGTSLISYNHKNILYDGRIGSDLAKNAAALYWSGSSIKIDFKGTGLKMILEDENQANYYNVILDGKLIKVLRPDSIKRSYTIVENLKNQNHSVELFKRTEWTKGKTLFYGLQLNQGGKILPKKTPNRFIEFYGDSITCGYAVEDESGKDRPDSIYTNNYVAYGAITSRHFDASYACIARSGIGLTVSWFNQIMQDIYWRLDPADSTSQWNFNQKKPDIIIVNLFQNDSWITNMPDYVEFKRRFGKTKPSTDFIIATYKKFIADLRTKNPKAEIICMLGNMDITKKNTVWTNYVQTAVDALKDEKIHTLFVPFKETDGHPNVKEQQEMANKLIQFIASKFNWM
jgi:hypothetical protein